MKETWIVTMLMSFSVLLLIQLSGAAPPCNAPEVWHDDGTGGRCCRSVNCTPGMEPKVCSDSSLEAVCVQCPAGTFNAEYLSSARGNGSMPKCKRHSTCDSKYQYEKSHGSATQDVVCGCFNETYWQLAPDGKCHKTCPPGEHLPTGEELCVPCVNGTFKNVNGTHECSPCTVCNKTETECNAMQDAACGLESMSPVENQNNAGMIIGLVVGFIVVGLFVGLLVCWQQGYINCGSYSPRRSSDRPITASDHPESELMPPDDNVNASSGQTASSRQQRKLDCFKCCGRNLSGSRSHNKEEIVSLTAPTNGESVNDRRPSGPENDTTQPTVGNGHATDVVTQPDGSNSHLSGERTQPASSTSLAGANLGQPASSASQPGANLGQPASSASQPGANLGQPASNTPQPGANLGQPASSASLPGANLGQPASSAHQPGANLGQPGPLSSGGLGVSQEGVDPRNAKQQGSSLCSYIPPVAVQSTSQGAHRSLVSEAPHSGTLQEPDFDLQSDDPSVDEGIVKKYISKIQKNYTKIMKMFSVSNGLINYLYQEKFLTFEEMTELQELKKKANGDAEAFRKIQERLQQRGDKAAKIFLEALVHPETRLDALAEFIDQERAEELIKKRGDPDANSVSDFLDGRELPSNGDVVDSPKRETGPDKTHVKIPSNTAIDPGKTQVKIPSNTANDPDETLVKIPSNTANDPDETLVKIPSNTANDPDETLVKIPSNTANDPDETLVKIPSNTANDPDETPVKEVDAPVVPRTPQTIQTKKADDTGELWADHPWPASTC